MYAIRSYYVSVPHVPYFPLEKMLAVAACLVFAYINFRGASETGKAGNIVTLASYNFV